MTVTTTSCILHKARCFSSAILQDTTAAAVTVQNNSVATGKTKEAKGEIIFLLLCLFYLLPNSGTQSGWVFPYQSMKSGHFFR